MALIGIWWDDGSTCIGVKHAITKHALGVNLLHSDLSHADQWPEVAPRFGLSSNDEYFLIPRGRVAVIAKSGHGIIFHGRSTSVERLPVIAAEFRLNSWEAQLDEHYSTGADADLMFDDD